MDEPQHPELYRKLKDSFGPTYLTVLSIIQGVALADLAGVVAGNDAHFTLVHWLLVLMSFCVLIVTWNVYALQSVMWNWIPDLRDSAIPFLVGAVELFLNHAVVTSLTAWLAGLAVFAFIGALATRHIDWRATSEPENAELLAVVRSHHRLFAGYLAADGMLLLIFSLISGLTGASASSLGHGARGILALALALATGGCFSGALYLDHEYLRKAVAFARTGHAHASRRVRASRVVAGHARADGDAASAREAYESDS